LFTYKPPKSSVWGHSLRKIPPDQIRSRFREFLGIAVSEHILVGGSLLYQPTMDTVFKSDQQSDCMSHFARLLGGEKRTQSLGNLDSHEVETCLDELISNDSLYVLGGAGAVVMAGVRISRWRLRDLDSATHSLINIYYGANPRISTFLTFNEIEEFMFVRQALDDAGLCRLNEKHLKKRSDRKRT
jgi:hypothetical protein